MTKEFVFVDLDGTLIQEDSLHVSLAHLLRQKPHILPLLIWVALTKSKHFFKSLVAQHFVPNSASFTYRKGVLEAINERKAAGHNLILATGANQKIAHVVRDHLGLFSECISSDHLVNLTGKDKLKRILEMTGGQSFTYFGDSSADIPIFMKAGSIVIVGNKISKRDLETLRATGKPIVHIE